MDEYGAEPRDLSLALSVLADLERLGSRGS
jgi:hypothetical protein